MGPAGGTAWLSWSLLWRGRRRRCNGFEQRIPGRSSALNKYRGRGWAATSSPGEPFFKPGRRKPSTICINSREQTILPGINALTHLRGSSHRHGDGGAGATRSGLAVQDAGRHRAAPKFSFAFSFSCDSLVQPSTRGVLSTGARRAGTAPRPEKPWRAAGTGRRAGPKCRAAGRSGGRTGRGRRGDASGSDEDEDGAGG